MKGARTESLRNASAKSKTKAKVDKKKKTAIGDADKENQKVSPVVIATPVTPQKKAQVSQSTAVTMTPSGKSINLSSKKSAISSPRLDGKKISNPTTLFESESRVKKVYKIVQKSTGALGGNGYNGAIYGELTLHSMQKVIDYMVDKCEMSADSMFIDVGSGLGKPNFHACQDPGVRISIGIELEEIRWQLAMQNLKTVLKETRDDALNSSEGDDDTHLLPGVNFIHGDIFDVVSTDPFTHVYMYDLGFPPSLQQKIAEYFNASTHAQYLVSYRPPRRVIKEYGFDVEEIGKMPTSMTGSGESHTAYFYKRTSSPAPCVARTGTSLLTVPAREASDLRHSDVVCSNYFKESIEHALGPVQTLARHVESVSDQILNAGRPKRERKPRNLNL